MQALRPRPLVVPVPPVQQRLAGRLAVTRDARLVLEAAGVALAALLCAWSRLRFSTRFLFNWDAIQFALGVQRFDIMAHRPHPPGYLGFVLLGRLTTALADGDAERGLTLLSALGGAAAVALAYLAARDMFGRFAALSAAVLLLVSPLGWFYGATALTYGLEPTFAIVVLWMAVRSARGDGRALALAAIAAAAAGAVRPTDEVFLAAPLAWAGWQAWRGGERKGLVLAAITLGVATLAWVAPLLVLSGGPRRFLTASAELSARASDTSAVWKTGLYGLRLNGGATAAGLALALGLFAPVGAAYLVARRVPNAGLRVTAVPQDYTVAATCLVVPTLAVYVFVHIGQLGYLLLPLPAFLLPAGAVLQALSRMVARPRRAGAAALVALAACAAANITTFAVPQGGMRDQLVRHDADVAARLAMVRSHDPATTLVITSAEPSGSYRLAGYYLGQYRVMAVGADTGQHAGEMFSTFGGAPEYDLKAFDHASQPSFPEGVRTVLVLDTDAAHLLGDFSRLRRVTYGDGQHAWVAAADHFMPVAFGRFLYLESSDCPCHGAATTARPAPPGAPL